MVALALQLRKLGHEVRICAPPDFSEWIDNLGIPFRTRGAPDRSQALSRAGPPAPVQLRQLMEEDTVAGQFEAVTAAARG